MEARRLTNKSVAQPAPQGGSMPAGTSGAGESQPRSETQRKAGCPIQPIQRGRPLSVSGLKVGRLLCFE